MHGNHLLRPKYREKEYIFKTFFYISEFFYLVVFKKHLKFGVAKWNSKIIYQKYFATISLLI